ALGCALARTSPASPSATTQTYPRPEALGSRRGWISRVAEAGVFRDSVSPTPRRNRTTSRPLQPRELTCGGSGRGTTAPLTVTTQTCPRPKTLRSDERRVGRATRARTLASAYEPPVAGIR